MNHALAKFIVLSMTVAATLLAFEVALRFTDYKYLLTPGELPDNYFQTDPELGSDLAPGRPAAPFIFQGPTHEIFTNVLGCFDHDRPIKEGYILAMGDSATWGFVALENKWTTHLEKLTGRQIVNCGVPGIGTKYQIIKARNIIKKIGIQPDMILLLHTHNDFNDDAVFPSDTVVEGQRVRAMEYLDLRTGRMTYLPVGKLMETYESDLRKFKAFLQKHIITLALARRALKQLRSMGKEPRGPLLHSPYEFWLFDVDTRRYPWVEKAFEDHADAIKNFHRMAIDNGATFVLFDTELGLSHTQRGQRLRDELRAIMAKEMPYYSHIDQAIRQAAKGQKTNHRFDPHWDELGNRLAADVMYRYLTDAQVLGKH